MNDYENVSYMKKSNYIEKIVGSNLERSIIWCLIHYDSDTYNRTEISSLPICTLRKNDFIVLIDSDSNREIWKWGKKVFNYSDNQAFWIEDYITKEKLHNAFEKSIEKFIHLRDNSVVVSMMIHKNLREAYINHGIKFLDMQSMYYLPDKRWLYSTVPGCKVKSPWEYTFPKNVNTPRGYACYSDEELPQAKKLLEENYGIKNFMVKIPYDCLLILLKRKKISKTFLKIQSLLNSTFSTINLKIAGSLKKN